MGSNNSLNGNNSKCSYDTTLHYFKRLQPKKLEIVKLVHILETERSKFRKTGINNENKTTVAQNLKTKNRRQYKYSGGQAKHMKVKNIIFQIKGHQISEERNNG